MICGNKFDCNSWIDKYSGNSQFPSAKCVQNNGQTCLAAYHEVTEKEAGGSSGGLSVGGIAGIVIGIVAVAVIIIVVIVVIIRRYSAHRGYIEEVDSSVGLENFDDEQSENYFQNEILNTLH